MQAYRHNRTQQLAFTDGCSRPGWKKTLQPQSHVRRGMSAILNHPWIPTSGEDAISVRGFIYDVDTGRLSEVSFPGETGSTG